MICLGPSIFRLTSKVNYSFQCKARYNLNERLSAENNMTRAVNVERRQLVKLVLLK